MSRHILVAMDRSQAAEAALEFALDEYPDATITVLHVIESNDPLDLFTRPDPSEYIVPACGSESDLDDELVPDPGRFERGQRKRAEIVFERACQISDEYDKEIELVVESGQPAPKIAEYAEEHRIDRIVIGYRDRNGLNRLLLRDISTSIPDYTSVPVTIVC